MLKSFKKAMGMDKKAIETNQPDLTKVDDFAKITTMEQCLNNKNTRDECLRRILDSVGLHPSRPLGTNKSDYLDLPETPHAFNKVAGAILDPAGTQIVAVVDKSGNIERLPKSQDHVLPPHLAGNRPAYAIGEVFRDEPSAPPPPPPGIRPGFRPSSDAIHRIREQAALLPTKLRPSTPSQLSNSTVVTSAAPNAPPSNVMYVSQSTASAAAASDIPTAPALDIPASPFLVYSNPLINGHLPVVTPATKNDAKLLKKAVAKAPMIQKSAHDNLLSEIRARKNAHEEATKKGTLKPSAYQKIIIQSGTTFTPVLHDVRKKARANDQAQDLMSVMQRKMNERQAKLNGVAGVNTRAYANNNKSSNSIPSPDEWD
jgi:hypothetical protein